jgi:putative FmdB family regulatory protein
LPNYTYLCCTCGAAFALFRAVAFRDDAGTCPICGSTGRRQFEACAIRQPCADWSKLTARDILGRENKSDRVIVSVGNSKPIVR